MLTSMVKGKRGRPPAKPAARPAGPLFLTEWMAELGVDDAELARRLKTSATTVWRWQQSPTRLNPLKQAQVARALGIPAPLLWFHPKAKPTRMVRLILEEEKDAGAIIGS